MVEVKAAQPEIFYPSVPNMGQYPKTLYPTLPMIHLDASFIRPYLIKAHVCQTHVQGSALVRMVI